MRTTDAVMISCIVPVSIIALLVVPASASHCRNMWKAAHEPQCAGDMFMHLPKPYKHLPSMFCELINSYATCNELLVPGNLTHHVSLDANCACPSGKPAVVIGNCIDLTGKWQLSYYGCDMHPLLDTLSADLDAAFEEDTVSTYASAYYDASDAPQLDKHTTTPALPTTYELVPLLSGDDRSVMGFDLNLAGPPSTTLAVRLQACNSEKRGTLEVSLDNHVLLQGVDNVPTTMHMALEGIVLNYTFVSPEGPLQGGETLNIQTASVNVSVVHALSCSLDVLTFEHGEPYSVWNALASA